MHHSCAWNEINYRREATKGRRLQAASESSVLFVFVWNLRQSDKEDRSGHIPHYKNEEKEPGDPSAVCFSERRRRKMVQHPPKSRSVQSRSIFICLPLIAVIEELNPAIFTPSAVPPHSARAETRDSAPIHWVLPRPHHKSASLFDV